MLVMSTIFTSEIYYQLGEVYGVFTTGDIHFRAAWNAAYHRDFVSWAEYLK